ncbi:THI20 [Candida oxycetoniae]|uniref:THI20 n=1 Tax=Candida oxycetoniae TaxID=497107 RepID=A0AAI9SXT1_9ASCO|nr:THI20 [Candida oxycetoniae]KAI3404706.2 THI20 [Candida oxycetoniae]
MRSQSYKLKDTEAEYTKLPVVLTVAGSDSSGGAGIEADLKTFSAFGVYGMTCITALTAQNTTGVKTFDRTSQKLVSEILKADIDDMFGYEGAPLKVIKTGMLTREAIEELANLNLELKMIVDPVMISTSGSELLGIEGVKLCMDKLVERAYLLTPNFLEAKTLYKIKVEGGGGGGGGGEEEEEEEEEGEVHVANSDEFKKFVLKLQKLLGCKNLLVKGGHIPFEDEEDNAKGKKVVDILYESEEDVLTTFESRYIESENTHGTGCTLASAIAANVAKDKSLVESVAIAIDYVHRGMRNMSKLGFGNGPLNHTVHPKSNIDDVVKTSEGVEMVHFHNGYTVFDYLKSHPNVKDNWQRYVQHPFVKAVAQKELAFDKFFHYLKQDYHYLIIYAQMHGLLASKATTYQQAHAQATIIGEIVTEIEKHKEKLKAYNVDYDIDEVKPGQACVKYCKYLLNMGQKEDFLGIKIALAPCLHGYAEAGAYGQALRRENPRDSKHSHVFQNWLNDYTSDWYLNSDKEGKAQLDELTAGGISKERMESLVKIFNDVVLLEINFWDEVLQV